MPRINGMHLDGPLEGEAFMKREGVNPEGDDLPEWLDNERPPEQVEELEVEEDEDLDDDDLDNDDEDE